MVERAAYPLNEAAALLGGICRATLYNMEARGELRMVRLGRRALIPADEIKRLVSTGTEGHNSDRPTDF